MRIFITTLILLLFAACTKKPEYSSTPFIQMGTIVTITLPASDQALVAEVESLIATLSETITDDCARISSNSDEVEISTWTYRLLQRGEELIALSGGVFDPAIEGVVRLYGFPEGPYSIPAAQAVTQEMEKLKSTRISLRQDGVHYYATGNGLAVDLGAYAKGWIVDMVASMLKDRGLSNFIINAGGDLYASGEKNKGVPWRLGITDPDKEREYVQAVALQDKALATSGIYERFFIADDGRRISHIFNAHTGLPVTYLAGSAAGYKSLSVIADNVELADALSTIYFLLPEAEIQRLCMAQNTPVYLIRTDGAEVALCGWKSI
jgi:thiamine biosynthesis lipoprotein